MSMKRLALFASIAFCASASVTVVANQLEGLSAYRGVDGTYSQQSRENLEDFIQSARQNGEVFVWVGFDMAYEARPEYRTEEVVQAEMREKLGLIGSIVIPLENAGLVRIMPIPEQADGAPGCKIAATAGGLRAIARNQRVKFIGYLPE